MHVIVVHGSIERAHISLTSLELTSKYRFYSIRGLSCALRIRSFIRFTVRLVGFFIRIALLRYLFFSSLTFYIRTGKIYDAHTLIEKARAIRFVVFFSFHMQRAIFFFSERISGFVFLCCFFNNFGLCTQLLLEIIRRHTQKTQANNC